MRAPVISLVLVVSTVVVLHATPLKTGTAKLKLVTKVMHPPLNEMSGLVKSRRYENVWWVHNDSGDQPRLFALDENGKVIFPPYLKNSIWADKKESGKSMWGGLKIHQASNIDWEDIAADKDSLYISDMGNNGNARRDLGVYQLSEPNPRAVDKSRILRFIPIRYPDQKTFPGKRWDFDCESLFVSDGKLYFLTKHRRPGKIKGMTLGTKLYRLDTKKASAVNTLTLVGKHSKLFAPTAADLSPDGRLLAILTMTAIWIFEKPKQGDDWLSGNSTKLLLPLLKSKQAEGLCFDGLLKLRINNEQGEVYQLDISAHFPGKGQKTPRKKF
ncbi:MAG: hypothetical protein P1V97_07870 [Planctomycetota bacterium]|nr:hypothetical protein [Planctomycetota bacterium]